MTGPNVGASPIPSLNVSVEISGRLDSNLEFSKPFKIGRAEECEL